MIKTKLDKSVLVTLEDDLCVGCGICKLICPTNAITMFLDKNKEFRPDVSSETCVNCGLCLKVCPSSRENLVPRISEATQRGFDYGLENAIGIYKGYEINYDNYIKSASGGILSSLIKNLLIEKKVDAVIHAEQLFGNSDKKYFTASISKTPEDIENKRSSFYFPIEFSEVLEQIKNDENIKTVAILGVPCVLAGVELLKKKSRIYREKIKYSFSFICSHNVSGQFADCIVNHFPQKGEDKILTLRDKHDIEIAGDFNNSVKLKDGTYYKESRYKTPFTENWRTHAYAYNACFYCPDFLGKNSDAGFKDAWSFDAERKEGETVFFVNNPEIDIFLKEMKEKEIITFNKLSKKDLINSQFISFVSKTKAILLRSSKHSFLKKHFRFSGNLFERFLFSLDFIIKRQNERKSKYLRRVKNRNLPKFWLKKKAWILKKVDVFTILLFKYKNLIKNTPEVLYTAGFGYDNMGDEAQLSLNLQIWKEEAPNVKLTILSPNPEYTRELHGNYDILKASRNLLWGFRGIEYAGIGNKKYFKPFFRLRFFHLRISSFFIKHFNIGFFNSPETSYFLKRLKNAKVLHIGGGGYLTGKTQSRLFDYMGLIHFANYFKTDIILSGHNIGIWQNSYHKKIAKQLRKVKYIGLRDNEASVESLKEIGLFNPENVLPLIDDALFCDGANSEIMKFQFEKNNINFEKSYILINAHYFKHTEKIVKSAIEKLAEIIDKKAIENELNIILLSMHTADLPALEFFRKKLKTSSKIFNHSDDFKIAISLIKNAYLTITMRHHPIIFSMAGAVPTMSLVFDDYFLHKNIGAMKLFGQEKFVRKSEDLFNGKFEERFNFLIENHKAISSEILNKINEYKPFRGLIIKKYISENLKYNAK